MRQVVRLILFNSENKILLVKHGKPNLWALPGGHIELGKYLIDSTELKITETQSDIDLAYHSLKKYVSNITGVFRWIL